jgi:two-component system CheB/CheR fusion protein
VAEHKEGMPASPELSLAEITPADLPPGSLHEARILIVGIGASAGGLEALTEFFSHMPPDSGMAFVVITHQSADRISLLPELIGKHTAMSVGEVTAGLKVEPNQVYLPPPGQYLALLSSVLQPMPGDTLSGSVQFPIDYFFRSLADDQKDKAICIVLSGTGTDGTLGVRAVKDAGGLILAQEETTGHPQLTERHTPSWPPD